MPSGKIVAYDYDETGQITRVSGTVGTNNRLYANGFSYADTERSSASVTETRNGRPSDSTLICKLPRSLSIIQANPGYGVRTSNTATGTPPGQSINQRTTGMSRNRRSPFRRSARISGFVAEQQYAYDPLNRLI
ncbi:MAG: hypothetical protein IPK58_07465 [Acidobacteria bacterium]|nr:hypothetical protein [Acidobacteriota bacterium]